MTTKLELPGDHWVILKDPMDITERQARSVQRKFMDYGRRLRGPVAPVGEAAPSTPDPTSSAAPESDMPDDDKLQAVEEMEHFLVAYMVDSWDFDSKPNAEGLYDIPRPVYNAIDEAVQPLLGELIPALKKKDEDSPTTP